MIDHYQVLLCSWAEKGEKSKRSTEEEERELDYACTSLKSVHTHEPDPIVAMMAKGKERPSPIFSACLSLSVSICLSRYLSFSLIVFICA